MEIVRLSLKHIKDNYDKYGLSFLQQLSQKNYEISVPTKEYLNSIMGRTSYEHCFRNGVTEEALEEAIDILDNKVKFEVSGICRRNAMSFYYNIENRNTDFSLEMEYGRAIRDLGYRYSDISYNEFRILEGTYTIKKEIKEWAKREQTKIECLNHSLMDDKYVTQYDYKSTGMIPYRSNPAIGLI